MHAQTQAKRRFNYISGWLCLWHIFENFKYAIHYLSVYLTAISCNLFNSSLSKVYIRFFWGFQGMIIILTESQQRTCVTNYWCLLPMLAQIHPATPSCQECVCSLPVMRWQRQKCFTKIHAEINFAKTPPQWSSAEITLRTTGRIEFWGITWLNSPHLKDLFF